MMPEQAWTIMEKIIHDRYRQKKLSNFQCRGVMLEKLIWLSANPRPIEEFSILQTWSSFIGGEEEIKEQSGRYKLKRILT